MCQLLKKKMKVLPGLTRLLPLTEKAIEGVLSCEGLLLTNFLWTVDPFIGGW